MTNGTLITLIGISLGKYPQTGNTDAIRQALKCNLNPVNFYSLVSVINSYNPLSLNENRMATEWKVDGINKFDIFIYSKLHCNKYKQ